MNKIVELTKRINQESLTSDIIQSVFPVLLSVVERYIEEEVEERVGNRYERNSSEYIRHGVNPGSVSLLGQKFKITVPRIINKLTGVCFTPERYKELKSPPKQDRESLLTSLIKGVSARNYEKVFSIAVESFGLSKSSVSRNFIDVSKKELKAFFERDLSKEDIIAIFIDGKHLMCSQATIALGVTMDGDKIPLGFVESSSENSESCTRLLNDLIDRGLPVNKEILFIIDGSKALRKAVKDVFGNKGIVQRCQWHKRRNILSYLAKKYHDEFRRKLQKAYEQETYSKAKKQLLLIYKELKLLNEDAANSLKEGLEETLTLHKLGVFGIIGKSFKTTNCIENLNRGVRDRLSRVCKWKNSNQKRRWLAVALIDMEPNFAKVEGYKKLPLLRKAMKNYNNKLNFFQKMVA